MEVLSSPNRDGRDSIATTLEGLYFDQSDHAFLDRAWRLLYLFGGVEGASGFPIGRVEPTPVFR